jgi:predicted  nucleic acid-binding Zn-ribbon protein
MNDSRKGGAMTRIPVIFLTGCLLALPAWGKDVATEQYNATQARKHYLQARDEYETLTRQADAQAQRVAQEQARLEDLRKRQQAAKAEMDGANTKMKERHGALEKAWNSRK